MKKNMLREKQAYFLILFFLLFSCKKVLLKDAMETTSISMYNPDNDNGEKPDNGEQKEGDYQEYVFGDNAWYWRCAGGKGEALCRGSKENYTELQISLSYSKDSAELKIWGIAPDWSITYSRSNALGPLEDKKCMEGLFGMLVEEQNHSAIAQDLLENTNLALGEKEQRMAALILESIVILLRTEIQQGFRDYLGKIMEGKDTFSGDAMSNFLLGEKNGNDRITLNQFKYHFGDNVEAIFRKWKSLTRGKEYVKITSRRQVDVDIVVKSSAEHTAIKQLAGKEAYYLRLLNELRGDRTDQDHLLAADLLENKDCTIRTYRQQEAAAALEAIIALAEQEGKHEAVSSFRDQLQAAGKQGGKLDFIEEMMRNEFQEEYYKVYGHGTEGESEEDENYYLGDEDEYSK
ncbi:MAG: hypothetical protein MI674_03875 [Cytophagales bacterium]|nr:hypothetical protein [Cytophagales bacterium]